MSNNLCATKIPPQSGSTAPPTEATETKQKVTQTSSTEKRHRDFSKVVPIVKYI